MRTSYNIRLLAKPGVLFVNKTFPGFSPRNHGLFLVQEVCLFVGKEVVISCPYKKKGGPSEIIPGKFVLSTRCSDLILPCEYPFESDISKYRFHNEL